MATARDRTSLLAGAAPPPPVSAARVAAEAARGARVVVLDDDPTGTQSVADIPVITSWELDDVRWAFGQDAAGFYILTNTRSLDAAGAARRNREVLEAVWTVADAAGVAVSIISRGDSTLRGHFPLETDVLAEELGARGRAVGGVALIPAYLAAGRITIDGTHWVRTQEGFIPAGESEFARDPQFGYAASFLPDFVAEQSAGAWRAEDVTRVTLSRLRRGDPGPIAAELRALRGRRPVVVDAAAPEDLRVFALAAIEAERHGASLLYRSGPSFVRERLGQDAHAPISDAALRALLRAPDAAATPAGGLVVAGSYVGLTTRQLAELTGAEGPRELILDVRALLDPQGREALVASLAATAADALATGDVLVATSRERIDVHDELSGRSIQATVSRALVEVVARTVARRPPRWILAKGGITSSDIATDALGIRRAWARGTLLDGIVSLWEPALTGRDRIPYVVFAGNVGDSGSLAAVVDRLRRAC